MKKILILMLAILLLTPVVLARETHYSNDDNLRIDLVSYSPSPALAGSESKLRFEVTNTGVRTIKNLELKSSAKFPLEPKDKTILIKELKSSKSEIFEIKIKINPAAEEGTYNIFLQFEEPTTDQISVLAYDIIVKRLKRTVASIIVTTEPEYIPPGGIAFINVEIENNADFSMKDVEVKLNFSDTVPLAPYQSTTQKQISLIKSQSSETARFQVIALPDGEPNVYRLPLFITYNDELGNEITRQDYIGIIISKKPEYDITIEDSILIKGQKDEVTISISNTGPSNIKYLIFEILPSKYYKILNPPRTYIGHLEPDDYETAEFDIIPRRSGKIPIKVKLEYKDDMNNPVKEIKEVEAYIYSRTYAKMLGIIPGGSLIKLITYLIIISFIYITYKTWRKTRNIVSSMKYAALRILVFIKNIVIRIKWHYLKRIPRKIKIFFIKLK